MGLLIQHHLDAMFNHAQETVITRQFLGCLGGDPVGARQFCQHVEGAPPPQIAIASPGDELLGLDEELDLADAAAAELDVVAGHGQRFVPAHGVDLPLHGVHVGDRREVGREVMREVLGAPYVAKRDTTTNDFNAPIRRLSEEFAYATLWTREGLDRKTRSFLNLAMLTALNRPHELKLHVRGAINNGLTKDEIKEVSQVMSNLGSVSASLIEKLLVDFVSQMSGTGSLMGVNCSDTYGAGNNGDRNWLGPATELDPWLGTWNPIQYHRRGVIARRRGHRFRGDDDE